MTAKEALRHPELRIHVTELIEYAFYFQLALNGKVSDRMGERMNQKMQSALFMDKIKESDIENALRTADQRIKNIEKYGVACAEWCD